MRSVFVAIVVVTGVDLRAEEPSDREATPEQTAFFENKVRPLLVEHCYSCHGPEKNKGNLRVDSLGGMIEGGDSGPAVVPGKPLESLLVEAVNYESFEMPPTGKLSAEKIDIIAKWIEMGAPWPGAKSVEAKRVSGPKVTDEDRQFWSFLPVQSPLPPAVTQRHRAESPIDLFIGSTLEAKGLMLSPEANRRTLIRRLSVDLTGLPPTYSEMAEYESDPRDDHYARLVDRLLASPRLGERWGRHWLDVVRYAQSNGYERDAEKPFAWRYRDYVIDAFNEDKPYDRFVREQLAGDEIYPGSDEAIIATGFQRLGVWDDEPDDKANATFEALDDLVSTTGLTFLGLTVGCARCHDHKFDPISSEDYYGLVAFFRPVREYEKFEGNKPEYSMLVKLSTGEDALAVREQSAHVPSTHVLIRGDAHSPASEVDPSFLEVLCEGPDTREADIAPPGNATSTGRRKALAEWIARPDHPLTARVISNRLWHYHFGRGIVATPSDFGKTGDRPTHPELLDWLASDLVTRNWSLKHQHRLLVESAVYRQSSSTDNSSALAMDAPNSLLWHQNLRRLEAEAMRDAVLDVTGELSLEMHGKSFYPDLPPEVLSTQSRPGEGWGESTPDQRVRRSVYSFVKRTLKTPMMETFDAANPDQAIASRVVTTIAPQALVWYNSQFMEQRCQTLAEDILRMPSLTVDDQIQSAFERILARSPDERERERARELLHRHESDWKGIDDQSSLRPLAGLCRVLFNLNEFVYVD